MAKLLPKLFPCKVTLHPPSDPKEVFLVEFLDTFREFSNLFRLAGQVEQAGREGHGEHQDRVQLAQLTEGDEQEPRVAD